MEYSKVIKGFDEVEINGVKMYESKLFKDTGLVKQVFTARQGGVSEHEFSSLNFSFKRESNSANVLTNYKILADTLNLDPDSFILVNGDHTSRAVYVDESIKGMGITRANSMSVSDGMTTDRPNVTLTSTHADCVPIYFLDTKKPAVAIAHAGWKGTYSHVVLKTIDLMKEKYESNQGDILVAIGPAIGKCCFEVGDDVADMFENEFGNDISYTDKGKKHVDLVSCIIGDLIDAGIDASHINVADMCTCCEKTFFSHRRDCGKTGTMLALLTLV